MQGRIEADDKLKMKIENKLYSLPGIVRKWFNNLQAKEVTMKSCNDYINKVGHFIEFFQQKKHLTYFNPADVDSDDLSVYFVSLQYTIDRNGRKVKTSYSYRTSVWFALNNFFEYCLDINKIEKNYMRTVKPKKSKSDDSLMKEKPLLTADDFTKMLNQTPGSGVIKVRNKAILLLYMTTGMRKDALCQINLEDIDMETGRLVIVDKGDKQHGYKLTPKTLTAINDWLNYRNLMFLSTDALFISERKERISGSSVAKLVNLCSEQALGYRISPHKLRSGLCSILYEKTHDIEFVRGRIGHSDISTTKRYIKTDDTAEEERAYQLLSDVI